MTRAMAILAGLLAAAALPEALAQPIARTSIAAIAEQYVRLGLALGQHDPDYVDAYYGPPEWKADATQRKMPLLEIDAQAMRLAAQLGEPSAAERLDEMVVLRYAYLRQQLTALAARARIVGGAKLRFDEESRALSGGVAPVLSDAHFMAALQELDRLLPGQGALLDRYEAFRKDFVIPADRVSAVFDAAVAECRRRTLVHARLPAGEKLTVEYVKGKPWGAYQWYQGNYRSLIQVNVDLPMYIGQATGLACHEGYPGHHVYYVLLEKQFLRDRGWVEFFMFTMFSPHSLVSEGAAEYGIELAFPGDERVRYWREVLFPLAGLDASRAEEYHRVGRAFRGLAHAQSNVARRYLDGELDREATVAWLARHTMTTQPYAERSTRFFDTYRSYVINYDTGREMVRNYVNARAGADATNERRWQVFLELLASPRLPEALLSAGQ